MCSVFRKQRAIERHHIANLGQALEARVIPEVEFFLDLTYHTSLESLTKVCDVVTLNSRSSRNRAHDQRQVAEALQARRLSREHGALEVFSDLSLIMCSVSGCRRQLSVTTSQTLVRLV